MTTNSMGGSGAVFVPKLVPARDDVDEAVTRESEPEDATQAEINEEASVAAHLDDPDVTEAIEKLRHADD